MARIGRCLERRPDPRLEALVRLRLVRLVFAESLRANGHFDRAAAAIARARAQLVERAARIGEEGHRESFLTRVPENARIIALAALWAADAPAS